MLNEAQVRYLMDVYKEEYEVIAGQIYRCRDDGERMILYQGKFRAFRDVVNGIAAETEQLLEQNGLLEEFLTIKEGERNASEH